MNHRYNGDIFIIHDSRREDRLKTLMVETELQGIFDFTLMPAVTTSRNGVENISRAHKNCIRAAKEAGMSRVLIMEDDIMFTAPDSFSRFLDIFQELPEDWKIYLGGVYDGHIKPISDRLATVTELSGLHCYIVNSTMYDIILNAPEYINLDKWLSGGKYGKIVSHLAYPMVAMQYDGFSDNVKRQTNYNNNIKNRFEIWRGHGDQCSSKEP